MTLFGLFPLLAVAAGKADPAGEKRRRAQDQGKALASSSTLNRLELTGPEADASSRYKKVVLDMERAERFFATEFVTGYQGEPDVLVLDDYHEIMAAEVHDALLFLLEHVGAGQHVAHVGLDRLLEAALAHQGDRSARMRPLTVAGLGGVSGSSSGYVVVDLLC